MADLVVVPTESLELPQRFATPAQAYIASLQSKHSREAMIWGLRAFAKALKMDPDRWEVLPWHQIDAGLLGGAQTKLAAQLSPNSVNTARAALRGTLRSAWRLGLLSEDQLRRLDDVAPVRGSRLSKGRHLSIKEQSALLIAASKAPGLLGIRNVALFAVALGGGLRRSELVSMTIEGFRPLAFDGKGGVAFVGKGNKESLQPLTPGAIGALQRWVNARGGAPGPLFPACDRKGRGWVNARLTGRYVAKLLSELGEEAAIGSVAPHDLRRTYGTSLLQAGADVGVTRRLMRHAKVETTLQYDLRGDVELATAAAYLNTPVP